MKKVLLIGLLLLLSISIFASTFSTFGVSPLYDSPVNKFELGFFNIFSYTFPVEGAPLEIGLGTRVDLSFSIPLDTLTLGFIPGISFVTAISPRMDLSFIVGPQLLVIMPDTTPTIVGFGGALDAALTFYLNSQRSVGFTIGSINYLTAYVSNTTKDFTFGYYGGAYVGITIRTGGLFSPLPLGYAYLDYLLWN